MKATFLSAAWEPVQAYFELTVQEPLQALAPVVRKTLGLRTQDQRAKNHWARVSRESLPVTARSEARPRYVGSALGARSKAAYFG